MHKLMSYTFVLDLLNSHHNTTRCPW